MVGNDRFFGRGKASVASLLLIVVTAASWFLFPLMVRQLNMLFFQTGFALCLLLAVGGVVGTTTWRLPALSMLQQLMLISWVGYLLALLFATLESASTYSLFQWCVLFVKFAFFLFLLLYINIRYIVATFCLYANLMAITVCFAIFAMILFAVGVEPLGSVDLGGKIGDVYWGAYYFRNYNDLICWPFAGAQDGGGNLLFRIQGLSEEPGTYAFALLPAFFWFLIAKRAYWRATVILFGLMFSFSLGVGLWLLILLPLMMRRSVSIVVPVFLFGAVCMIGMLSVVSSACIGKNRDQNIPDVYSSSFIDSESLSLIQAMRRGAILSPVEMVKIGPKLVSNKSLGAEPSDNNNVKRSDSNEREKRWPIELSAGIRLKKSSFQDRLNGLNAVQGYFKDRVVGTGAALGMTTVNNSISVGYAIAILEAGIIGGGFYVCLFAIMGYTSLKEIIILDHGSYHNRLTVVVALSVATLLVMGLQRMQPDLSFWHMWIYAIWFRLLCEKT